MEKIIFFCLNQKIKNKIRKKNQFKINEICFYAKISKQMKYLYLF